MINPQQQLNHSTQALRNLKQAEDQFDSMKRRLSALMIKQEKYNKRVAENQRKLFFHNQVQESVALDRRRKMKYLNQKEKELDSSRSRIRLERQAHEDNYAAIREDLSASKKAEYDRIKTTRQLIEKSLGEIRQSDHKMKNMRKNEIKDMEKRQRENVADYFMQKRSSFRESSVREGSGYDSRRSQKQKMLAELSAMQSKLLQSQSASRAALQNSYRKLQKITVMPTINTRSTREKSAQIQSEKLPQISNKSHDQDEYIFL